MDWELTVSVLIIGAVIFAWGFFFISWIVTRIRTREMRRKRRGNDRYYKSLVREFQNTGNSKGDKK